MTAATIPPLRRRFSKPRAGPTFHDGKMRRAVSIDISEWGWRTGSRGPAAARSKSGLVRISNTGRVSVFTGAAAIGQGLRTALAQICAGELGLTAKGHHRCSR